MPYSRGSAGCPGEIRQFQLTPRPLVVAGIATSLGPGGDERDAYGLAIDNHYWFRDLRIRAEMLPDGSMKGVLAGYWDIENLFDFITEVYIGPVHLGRSAANNLGYMCAGVYNALPRLADGHPDPKTGKCTSLSTVVEFEAVPAFVILPQQIAQASPGS